MKARKVKGLDPAAPLADNAERIVRVRLDELGSFMPRAADPSEVEALHDMRIAAKRLRYILEITGPCFGAYARTAVKMTKDLQDLLGEIHDCDVQIPEITEVLERIVTEDAVAIATAAGDVSDLPASAVRRAPHRRDYSGLVALLVHLRARRGLLFARFLEVWREYERKGYRARLEFAVSERSEPRPPAPEPAPDATADGAGPADDGAGPAEAEEAAPAEPAAPDPGPDAVSEDADAVPEEADAPA
jgi:hypothetical protein